MSTAVTWIVPAFYETPSSSGLRFDLTGHAKTLLANKPWERGFEYGFTESLKKLDPAAVEALEFNVTPLARRTISFEGQNAQLVEHHSGAPAPADLLRGSGISSWNRNLLIMQLRLAIDVEIPDEETDATGMSIEFIEWNHRAVALLTEIGELFRAAIHLTYHCEYPIIPTLANKPQGGGLLCVAAEGRMKFHKWDIAVHTYPAIFLGEYLGEFESFLSDLSTKWHLPLWPIHRFLKALGAEHVEMENLLDLLYALEGLFPTNTSSEFIRVAVALLLSNDRKNAFQANEALQKAFQYRNSIVHGAEAMTGMETITLHGKETLSQRLFPAIQRITAGMIRVAFGKLQRLQDMRVLRISVQDVLEHVFP